VAVHVPSGTRYGTSAIQNGRYNLSNMRVGGPYRITASFVGYQSKREGNVTLSLGQTKRIDFQLRLKTAELEEVSVVSKQTGVLSTENKGIGTGISAAQIDATPTQGRKLADITRLVPQSFVGNDDDDGPAVSFAGQNTDFNSIFIDGAVSNDVFGLSAQGTDGGQTGATPISLSALEAFNVDISPYDVTQSGFTGAAINAVTKSGTNEFEGSFEYYRRGDQLSQQTAAFGSDRYVGTLGGPIIKDKLFFFANVDVRRSETPQPLQTDYQGRNLDLNGDPDDGELDGLDEIRNFVEENTGYDPGTFRTRNTTVDSEKFLAKLDYNVNPNHRLTARYFFNSADNVDQFQSTRFGVNFGNSAEVFPNDTHNFMLQWNGSFGNQVSTKTTATYKNVEDDRGVRGEPFPHMTIFDGDAEIDLGSELFSQVNFLEQDVFTFDSQADIFLGDHTLTVGTHNEFYDITNKFVVFSPGLYEFSTPEAFAKTICDYAQRNPDRTADNGPNSTCRSMFDPSEMEPDNFFLHGYSLVDDTPEDGEFTSYASDRTDLAGAFQAIQLGFYAQDEWQVSDRLSMTYGLRVNLPKILDDPKKAADANSNTLQEVSNYYDLEGARAGETPDWRAMWEPRFGFNWDVFGDQTTKIRGGTGVFTSRLPFVWPASIFTTNGVSSDVVAGLGLELRRPGNHITRPEPGNTGFLFGDQGVDPSEITPTGGLHIMQDDFMYPRVLRTSLGIDQELPFGFIGTLEGQFSEKLQGIVVENVNLLPANENMDGPDDRPIYAYTIDGNALDPGADRQIDDRYGEGILRIRNTSKGYSYNVTAELEKEPVRISDSGSLSGSVSYSYGDARAINSFGGDTVGSLWDENEHVNGTNNLELARSEFSQGHRIQVSADWRQEFGDNFALTTSIFYTGVSGRPFSYTIGSSNAFDDGAATVMIGDEGGAPLLYTPNAVSQLNLSPVEDDDGNVVRTVEQQRADLQRFIGNVDYLDSNRGEYTERNGDRTPFEGVVDLKFSFEVFGEALGRQQDVNVNLNIFNFSALAGETLDDFGIGVGKNWGDRYIGQGTFDVLNFDGYVDPNGTDDNPNNNFEPIYESGLGSGDNVIRDKEDIFTKETAGNTYSSFYQVQLGVKYTF
jgi:outer membrane receptor for ferrienterochelin and colicin